MRSRSWEFHAATHSLAKRSTKPFSISHSFALEFRHHRVASFDHLVGAGEEGFGDRQADPFRRFDVDDQLELGGLLNRQIARLLAFEDATGVKAHHAKRFRKT